MTRTIRAMKDSGVDWIGDIPVNWNLKRMKEGSKVNPPLRWPIEGKTSFVPMEKLGFGYFDSSESVNFDHQGSYTRFQDGDILIAKVTPCFENGKIAIANNLIGGVGFGSTEIVAIRSIDFYPPFLMRVMQSPNFVSLGVASMNGTAGLQRVSSAVWKDTAVPFPEYNEQVVIASYLDHHTSIIDQEVTLLQKKIGLLQEQRKAIIFEAVTKGLDPSVPMKDSGVDWIGEIPMHWEVAHMKKMIIRNDGGVWGEDPSDVNLGDVVLRSTEQTEGGSWKIEDPAMRVLSATDKKKSLLKEGDLLITKSSGSSNHIGKTTMVDKTVAQMNACYSNFMQRIRVNKLGHSKFIYYFMNSTLAREQFVFLSKSTTGLANLSAETINQLLLCVPAKEEQMSIALSLDNKTSLIDREIALIEYKISLLQEQRKAIIFEAVTGKIDLSNYEPKESLESN